MSITVQTPKWKLTGPAKYFKTQNMIDKLCSTVICIKECTGTGAKKGSCINPKRIRLMLIPDKKFVTDQIKIAEDKLKTADEWLKSNTTFKKSKVTSQKNQYDNKEKYIAKLKKFITLYKSVKGPYPPKDDNQLYTWLYQKGIKVSGKFKKKWVDIGSDITMKEDKFIAKFKF